MDFLKLARSLEKEIISTRRDFHAHPELPFNEFRTADAIEKRLKSLGIKTRRMAGTGVVGDVAVKGAGRTVALRADIDALPITEATGLPFASKTPGVMHACGHDAHAAMLLAAARIIAAHADNLPRGVRLIFQPSEEFPPGGAAAMVREGVMDGVDEVYGLHVMSSLPSGRIAAESGPRMANADDVEITIHGRGAHGAGPHRSIDPVLTAAEAITSLQQIVSRNVAPLEPAVLSICMINAGTAYNIIPQDCTFRGTVRTFSDELHRQMPRLIRRVVSGVARAHGAGFEMRYDRGYSAVVNSVRETGGVRALAEDLFGKAVLAKDRPEMGAEDFSEYLKKAPGCYFKLGSANRRVGSDAPGHSPYFKVDESILWMGTAMMSALAFGRGAGK